MNKEDYVSLELAKKLMEKGFDDPCDKMLNEHEECYEYSCYTTSKQGFRNSDLCAYEVAIPTLYGAQKWLREKHKLHVDVGMSSDYSTDADGIKCDEFLFWCFGLYYTTSLQHVCDCEGEFDTYEEALNAGIIEALNYI